MLTVVPRIRILRVASILCILGVDAARVHVDNLQLVWRNILGDELHCEGSGAFGQAVAGCVACDFPVVDGICRDVDEVL